MWRLHHIVPIYKKGAPADPKNYRGVHLTSILSKVAERTLAHLLCPYFDAANIYGHTQWAFRPGVSSKDLVTYCVLCWLWAFNSGKKVGLLLTDISGAFDKVCTAYLLQKLTDAGVHRALCQLLSSYLAPREAKVVVNGTGSAPYVIQDEVYQGTVLGPPLWNVFFADVSAYVGQQFTEAKFADDLSVFRSFDSHWGSGEILSMMENCQASIHDWGDVNRVTFDSSKEHRVILSKREPVGESFKFLGPQIDTKLVMSEEVERIRGKAYPKVRAILRTQGFYNTAGLIGQFKAHVLPHIEGSIGAIFHASTTQLRRVDSIQRFFLGEICVEDAQAFLMHNLAPSRLRRNIAVLGFLHKVNIGKAHPHLQRLFPHAQVRSERPTRLSVHRHNRQIEDFCDGSQTVQFQQSIFGMVKIYNRLPQAVVDAKSIQAFQRLLTKMAKNYCYEGHRFEDLYCSRQIRIEGLNNNGVITAGLRI